MTAELPKVDTVPIASGVSALNSLAIGAGALFYGVAPAVVLLTLGNISIDVLEAIALLTFVFSMLGYALIRLSWRLRPTDAIFEADALRIAGGPLHGTAIPWDVIDAAASGIVQEPIALTRILDWPICRLRLAQHHREPMIIAEVLTHEDAASLEAVLAAIRARTSAERSAPEEAAPVAVDVLRCSQCGAPLVPSAAVVHCPYCGEDVAVPAEIQERVQSALREGVLEGRFERAVGALVRQPNAAQTTRVVMVGAFIGTLGIPLALAIALRASHHHHLDFGFAMLLTLVPVMFVPAGYFAIRGRFVDRTALRAMTLGFTARAAEREGGSLSCHACMAPLDTTRGGLLVRCLHCGVTNIAVDLGLRDIRLTGSTTSLEEAVDEQARDRRRWMLRTIASIPFFLTGVGAIVTLVVMAGQ